MAKKITFIICAVSFVLWAIFTFTPARYALPPGHAFIIIVVCMLIEFIGIGILIGLEIGDHARRPR